MLRKVVIVLGLCFSFALSAATNTKMSFNHMTVFGDSLSDNGNLYSYSWHMVPKSPPYYDGRFSDGPVWADLLSQAYFGKSLSKDKFGDYAVGGAGAILSPKEVLPYTLWTEISDYVVRQESEKAASTLFVVWIGANNYLYAPTDIDNITTNVVEGIEKGIVRLIEHKAKMIVIANLPDLGATPHVKEDGNEAIAHELTITHNHKLYESYRKLEQQYPDVRFAFFDAYKLFEDAMIAPEKFGITDTANPCYTGGYYLRALGEQANTTISNSVLAAYIRTQAQEQNHAITVDAVDAYIKNTVTREAVQNAYFADLAKQRLGITLSTMQEELKCDNYLFWDHVHPTKNVHKYIKQYFAETIELANLVPAA